MAEKQSYAEQNKARLKEITDSIETGIRELFQSDKYRQYLTTMSRFHRYSVNNQMLIYMQKPEATLVAGFNRWKDQFERNVKKGERGIKIIAPTPYKKKIEQEKLDPDTKMPILDADGNAVMEEKTIQIPMYKVVSVFDLAQTEGKPLPELASDLTGDVQNYDVFMEALRRSSPVPISIETMSASLDGYFNTEHQDIAIRKGMSEVQTVCAAVHEIAHAKLHNYQKSQEQAAAGDEAALPVKHKSRETEEIEAESISYAVCAYYGIETGANSFGYLAAWSKDKELSALRESLDTINRTCSGLISDIDRSYRDVMKERASEVALETNAKPLDEMNILEMVDHFMEQGMTEEQANDLAHTEWQARKLNDEPIIPASEKEISEDNAINAAADTVIDEIARDVQEKLPDQAPDNGYVPDPSMSIEAMNAYGYTDSDMMPLSKERALGLFERDIPVYMLYEDNTEAMAFETEEIKQFYGYFGVAREDWDTIKNEVPAMDMELIHSNREQTFLESAGDTYAIYQLKHDASTADLRFMGYDWLEKNGMEPMRGNYDLVYAGELAANGSTAEKLENLFYTFNMARPEDFKGHSLSVSDIVALKQDGVVSCHYCDSAGFKEVPAFLKPENYLKSAEMSMEDDFGMIDGIINNGPKQTTVAELEQQAKSGQPISLMDLADAVHRERKEKKPSVLAQLRSYQDREKKNTARKKSAEMEL